VTNVPPLSTSASPRFPGYTSSMDSATVSHAENTVSPPRMPLNWNLGTLPLMLRLLFVGIALLVLGTLGLLFQQSQDPGFLASLPDQVMGTLFHPVSEADYKERYRLGAESVRTQSWQDALNQLEGLQDQAHPLQPMVWIQLSRAYAGLAREGDAQRELSRVMNLSATSHFNAYARYLLAQSALRSGQSDKAREHFLTLVKTRPESDLALGAHYYLGEMAMAQKTPSQAAEHWLAYIRKSPEGAFAKNIVDGLSTLNPAMTPEDQVALGRAFLAADNPAQALNWLKKAPLSLSWLHLARAYKAENNVALLKDTVLKGLPVAQSQRDAEEGLKLLLSITPKGGPQKALLIELNKRHYAYGGDMVIWQLMSMTSGAEQSQLMASLVASYPKSDWAPETSWQRVWAGYKTGQASTFLPLADAHLATYSHTRSAPRVLFWRARTYERLGQSEKAQADYQALVKTYPRQFYAFRAQQILKGTSNPWRIPQTGITLPVETTEAAFGTSPGAPTMTHDEVMDKALFALISLGEWADVSTLSELFASSTDKAVIQAMVSASSKQPHVAIKTLSDKAFELYRAGDTYVPKAWLSSAAIMKTWYPLENADTVQAIAEQERLNPYLILALTRQESAFNKLAISSSKAMGLMQLLPSTAAEVAQQVGLKGYSTPQLFVPETNIRLGSRYLRGLHDRFGGNSIEAIGAYNGGPGAMTKWKAAIKVQDPDLFIESIPYDQTRDYIKSVYAHYWNYCLTYSAAACPVD
jgi:soluble lytic murein transglycosylase